MSRIRWFACSLSLLLLSLPACSAKKEKPNALKIQGTGATFPAVLYKQWFDEFDKANDDINVDYKPIGSGGGVKAFLKGDRDKDLDFGASDNGLTDSEVSKVTRGVVQLPIAAGAIAIVYNLPGVDGLKLSRKAYTGIFTGEIKTWDHDEIKKHNPGAKLEGEIQPIVRLDPSGTTFLFTNHMNAVNLGWREKYGKPSRDVGWPTSFIRKSGNEGVGGNIKQARRSIGYVDLGTAKDGNLQMALLENQAGKFVELTTTSAQRALEQVVNPTAKPAFIPDPKGEDVYPIVGFTYLMLYKSYDDKAKVEALKKLLTWCATQGQERCDSLGYVRLPSPVAEEVRTVINALEK